MVMYLLQVRVITSGPSLGSQKKMANLDQIITIAILYTQFALPPKKCWNPYFYRVPLWQTEFYLMQTNLDQIITIKNPKLGPDNNSTAVMLGSGPNLAILNLAILKVRFWTNLSHKFWTKVILTKKVVSTNFCAKSVLCVLVLAAFCQPSL